MELQFQHMKMYFNHKTGTKRHQKSPSLISSWHTACTTSSSNEIASNESRPYRQAGKELFGKEGEIQLEEWRDWRRHRTGHLSPPVLNDYIVHEGEGVTQLFWQVVHHNGVVCLVTKVKIDTGQPARRSGYRSPLHTSQSSLSQWNTNDHIHHQLSSIWKKCQILKKYIKTI